MLGGSSLTRACGLRAISNGMVTPTLFLWRTALVHSRTPFAVFFELCTKQIMNLQCGASVFQKAVTLCADVACLAWVWRMRGQTVFAPGRSMGGPLLSETMAAKEAKEADRLWWKTPRLFWPSTDRGQCTSDARKAYAGCILVLDLRRQAGGLRPFHHTLCTRLRFCGGLWD